MFQVTPFYVWHAPILSVRLVHTVFSYIYIFLWRCSPTRAMASSFLRFLDRTQRRITVDRTPLDEWSARRRDLYLTAHNTHNRQTSMPPVGFEPTISASKRPQTNALDHTATATGLLVSWGNKIIVFTAFLLFKIECHVTFTPYCVLSSAQSKRFSCSKIQSNAEKYLRPLTSRPPPLSLSLSWYSYLNFMFILFAPEITGFICLCIVILVNDKFEWCSKTETHRERKL